MLVNTLRKQSRRVNQKSCSQMDLSLQNHRWSTEIDPRISLDRLNPQLSCKSKTDSFVCPVIIANSEEVLNFSQFMKQGSED